jgi:hypothetical protein
MRQHRRSRLVQRRRRPRVVGRRNTVERGFGRSSAWGPHSKALRRGSPSARTTWGPRFSGRADENGGRAVVDKGQLAVVRRIVHPQLTIARESTALVRELAAVRYEVIDQELAAAIASAPEVLAALGAVDWPFLETVRDLRDQRDNLGERAQQLVEQVAAATRAHEFRERLAPVLAGIRGQAVILISEVGRRAWSVHPGSSATSTGPGDGPAPAFGTHETDPQPIPADPARSVDDLRRSPLHCACFITTIVFGCSRSYPCGKAWASCATPTWS